MSSFSPHNSQHTCLKYMPPPHTVTRAHIQQNNTYINQPKLATRTHHAQIAPALLALRSFLPLRVGGSSLLRTKVVPIVDAVLQVLCHSRCHHFFWAGAGQTDIGTFLARRGTEGSSSASDLLQSTTHGPASTVFQSCRTYLLSSHSWDSPSSETPKTSLLQLY